jgi:hypothetical protein
VCRRQCAIKSLQPADLCGDAFGKRRLPQRFGQDGPSVGLDFEVAQLRALPHCVQAGFDVGA